MQLNIANNLIKPTLNNSSVDTLQYNNKVAGQRFTKIINNFILGITKLWKQCDTTLLQFCIFKHHIFRVVSGPVQVFGYYIAENFTCSSFQSQCHPKNGYTSSPLDCKEPESYTFPGAEKNFWVEQWPLLVVVTSFYLLCVVWTVGMCWLARSCRTTLRRANDIVATLVSRYFKNYFRGSVG